MSVQNQRKSGAILSYVAIVLNTLVQLLYTPFLIRSLGQSEYGLYSLASSIIGYLTVLDLGFGNALIVHTAKYRAQGKTEEVKKMHNMFFVVFAIIGVVVGLLGVVLALVTPAVFSANMSPDELSRLQVMMYILAFNLFATFLFSPHSSIISAHERFVFQRIVSIANTLLKPLIMVPLLIAGFGSITLVIVITILNVAMNLSNWLYCKKKLGIKFEKKYAKLDKTIFGPIFGYSIYIFLCAIVDKVNWSVDQFILGAVSGAMAVSIYAVAAQINTLFVNLSTAISSVFLPKMSKMVAEKASGSELTDELIKVGRIQHYVVFFMMECLILFGKQFIEIWVGDGFEQSYYTMLFLIVPVSLPLIQNLGLSIMQAMNKYRFKAISTFVMAIFNVIISVFLAKSFGAVGSAMGTAIALIACNVFAINIYYKRAIGLHVGKFWLEIFKMTIMMIIPAVLIVVLMRLTTLGGLGGLILYGSLFTVGYVAICYVAVMNRYEKNLVGSAIRKIKRGKQ